MPETTSSPQETSQDMTSQMASEGALGNLRSEILKQLAADINRSDPDDDQQGFTKYYTKGSVGR